MKIIELEIKNVRGIRHIVLNPDGKNFAIWGPNGSGKSAVVDAIDFVLTGRITRLTGKGTGNITLKDHGPHIDSTPENAVVRAVIEIGGVKEPFEITRCIASPTKLECAKEVIPVLEPILALARRGQHVLTRREILKFITAEGSTRAEEIQALLNISEIEDIRKCLVKVQNDFHRDFQSKKNNFEMQKKAVLATTDLTNFDLLSILKLVNDNRALLNGLEINELKSGSIMKGVQLKSIELGDKIINVTSLSTIITKINSSLGQETIKQIKLNDRQIRKFIQSIIADPKSYNAYQRQELIALGIQLLDPSGNCPLCDTPWATGELKAYLEKKLQSGKEILDIISKINNSCSFLRELVSQIATSVDEVLKNANVMGLYRDAETLESWKKSLHTFYNSLSDPVNKYLDFKQSDVANLFTPEGVRDALNNILSTAKLKYPDITPEQSAFYLLSRLEENLKQYEKAEIELSKASISYRKSEILSASFEQARNKVLSNLYDSIRDRFVYLYKQLHKTDENNFEALLEPDGPSLNFGVSFYGRGIHPPHALHSEGHQDSMGLCLYLALAERLTGGLINLTILDDVVMSVDSDHRRDVCRILKSEFPGRQFFITTHDKTWAYQLKTEGVISINGGLIEFHNWKIDTGPLYTSGIDEWDKIELALRQGDVQGAAFKLRRYLEQFFSEECELLQGKVTFREDGRWELSDFLHGAYGQYRKLLKQAKNVANQWNNQDDFDALTEIESTAQQIYDRTRAEHWSVNSSIHYNNWASFTVNDFKPVVEAFRDLCDLFICTKCGGKFYVTSDSYQIENVRCRCGKICWNITKN